jgi:hypothetical protein
VHPLTLSFEFSLLILSLYTVCGNLSPLLSFLPLYVTSALKTDPLVSEFIHFIERESLKKKKVKKKKKKKKFWFMVF